MIFGPSKTLNALITLKFVEERDGAMFIGPPGLGKSHIAKAFSHLAVQRGYKVFYREAHVLIQEIKQARELGEIAKYRTQLLSAELMILDDLFLRRLPSNAGDELADVLVIRYEMFSTMLTSYRPIEDRSELWGAVA